MNQDETTKQHKRWFKTATTTGFAMVATPSTLAHLFPLRRFNPRRFVHNAFEVLQFEGLFFSHGNHLTQYH